MIIVKGITKIGRDFLAETGGEEEKPVEGGPSFVPIGSGLRTVKVETGQKDFAEGVEENLYSDSPSINYSILES